MKKLLCTGLALAALTFASTGIAVAGTVDSAYKNSSPPATTLLATTTADKMKVAPHSSTCTCCNCATAMLEKKSVLDTTAYMTAPPDAKPGVISLDTTYLRIDNGKVGGPGASFSESQGTVTILISTAGDGETTAGGTISATSGNSNAPQLLAGMASLTCALPGITFKV